MYLGDVPLIVWTDQGLYCPSGDFHIDPHQSVERAVITHAHSDHARKGSKKYFCETSGVGLLKIRLGDAAQVEGVPYRKPFILGNVCVSLHSAGHILGSAQVRIQHLEWNEVWVVSGDYKRDLDPSCEPFEVVKCNTFITEATFGTPKYVWIRDKPHGEDIYQWWLQNRKAGENSVLFGYSLGKAQRILAELAPFADRPILIWDSMADLTECYRQNGRVLADTLKLASLPADKDLRGELILAPPSIVESHWLERLGAFRTAFASGWMQTTGPRSAVQSAPFSRASYDYGFVMSDHADWIGLNQTIEETEARQVFVLHRGKGALTRHLRKKGINAHPISELTLNNYRNIVDTNLTLF